MADDPKLGTNRTGVIIRRYKLADTDIRGAKYREHPEIDPAEGLEMRRKREAVGLTLKEVCQIVGISGPYLTNLETGKRRWTEKMKERFLQALGEGAGPYWSTYQDGRRLHKKGIRGPGRY